MQKTSIEWVKNPDGSQGYTHNLMSGCKNHTPEGLCLDGLFPCYAFRLANGRLKPLYLGSDDKNIIAPRINFSDWDDPFYPRFWEGRLLQPAKGFAAYLKTKPKGVFVCDMGDLFGLGIPEEWTWRVLEQCKIFSHHRFYLLTKQAQRLPEFSPFPENCWVGVTATNADMFVEAYNRLICIDAKVKYISLEPFLSWCDLYEEYACRLSFLLRREDYPHNGIDWLIIGACTGTLPEMVRLCDRYPPETLAIMRYGSKFTAQPRIEWVREIVEAADKARIKVFLKDNLKPLLENDSLNPLYWANVSDDERGHERVDDSLRQEMPIEQ